MSKDILREKFIYVPTSYARDSEACLQAKLAYMEGDYRSGNNLVDLDRDLKQLGLSEIVNTPEAVRIALNIKDYILKVARRVAGEVAREGRTRGPLEPIYEWLLKEREAHTREPVKVTQGYDYKY